MQYITIYNATYKTTYSRMHLTLPRRDPILLGKYVAYWSVLSQISNCQGLGRKNKREVLKNDRSLLRTEAVRRSSSRSSGSS